MKVGDGDPHCSRVAADEDEYVVSERAIRQEAVDDGGRLGAHNFFGHNAPAGGFSRNGAEERRLK